MVSFRQEIDSDGIETSKALALRGGHSAAETSVGATDRSLDHSGACSAPLVLASPGKVRAPSVLSSTRVQMGEPPIPGG